MQPERLGRWEVLSAMQALSAYLLARMEEGETDYNNVDALLVRAIIVSFHKGPTSTSAGQHEAVRLEAIRPRRCNNPYAMCDV